MPEFYKLGTGDLLKSRRGHFNDPRNIAIHFMRRLKGDTLKADRRSFWNQQEWHGWPYRWWIETVDKKEYLREP